MAQIAFLTAMVSPKIAAAAAQRALEARLPVARGFRLRLYIGGSALHLQAWQQASGHKLWSPCSYDRPSYLVSSAGAE